MWQSQQMSWVKPAYDIYIYIHRYICIEDMDCVGSSTIPCPIPRLVTWKYWVDVVFAFHAKHPAFLRHRGDDGDTLSYFQLSSAALVSLNFPTIPTVSIPVLPAQTLGLTARKDSNPKGIGCVRSSIIIQCHIIISYHIVPYHTTLYHIIYLCVIFIYSFIHYHVITKNYKYGHFEQYVRCLFVKYDYTRILQASLFHSAPLSP